MNIKWTEIITTTRNRNGWADLMATEIMDCLDTLATTDEDEVGAAVTDRLQKWTGCKVDHSIAAFREFCVQRGMCDADELKAVIEGVIIGLYISHKS